MSSRDVPLFPLPDYILYPGTVQPLRIFEPRYLDMIQDLLDTAGNLVMGTVLGENKRKIGQSDTPVEPIGTLAQVLAYEPLDDGQYVISVLGLSRVRMTELEVETRYRQVRIEVLDSSTPSDHEAQLRPTLQEALESRWASESELPEEPPVSQLADLLLLHLGLSARETYALYSIQQTTERARAILERHTALD